jgi:uncharacterized membrane protein
MTRASLVPGFVVLAFAALPVMASSFQTIVSPGDPNFTQLLGINNAGTIAGYFGDGSVVPNNGFTLTLPSTYSPENYPASAQTQVVGINNHGETVGFWVDGSGGNHGFTDIGGTFTNVDDPLTTTVTQLLGVNDSGVAAGYYTDAAGNFNPFTWSGGVFTPIALPGLVSAQATGINDAGDVVGFNMTSSTTADGFLDIGGVFTTLSFPGSTFTQALGINDQGLVVGDYVDAAGNMHGFLYNAATGHYESVSDPNGPNATTINGINDKNQIVGFYATGATADGVTVTDGFVGTVPEPGSILLFGTALAALTWIIRKKTARR